MEIRKGSSISEINLYLSYQKFDEGCLKLIGSFHFMKCLHRANLQNQQGNEELLGLGLKREFTASGLEGSSDVTGMF